MIEIKIIPEPPLAASASRSKSSGLHPALSITLRQTFFCFFENFGNFLESLTQTKNKYSKQLNSSFRFQRSISNGQCDSRERRRIKARHSIGGDEEQAFERVERLEQHADHAIQQQRSLLRLCGERTPPPNTHSDHNRPFLCARQARRLRRAAPERPSPSRASKRRSSSPRAL